MVFFNQKKCFEKCMKKCSLTRESSSRSKYYWKSKIAYLSKKIIWSEIQRGFEKEIYTELFS